MARGRRSVLVFLCAFWFQMFQRAESHGSMYEPPSRNSQGMSLLAPTCPGGACQWYNQGCAIGCPEITGLQTGCEKPVEPSLKDGEDDELLQYKDDGYGNPTIDHPWRFPGKSPVADACGITAGYIEPEGQLDPPPGFSTGASGRELPKLLDQTVWVAGSVVEVAWAMAANHGGGYQYRLCPVNEELSEECFQKTPLEFVGEDQWIQFGNGYDPGNRIQIKARRVSGKKVVPENSTWTMNPIPGCAVTGGRARTKCSKPTFSAPADDRFWPYADGTSKGIFGYSGGYCFGNVTKKPSAACTLDEYKNASFDFGIVDRVKVPDLPEGDYVLSWRWDCEMTKQIWSNCADVTIKHSGKNTKPFSPINGCTACCTGICSKCKECREKKTGECASCWEPLPWWGGRDFWTPRAKAIQCLGREAEDGGPGKYMPGDPLEPAWSPGCSKCWASKDGCEKYTREFEGVIEKKSWGSWTFVTMVVLAVAAAVAGALLLVKSRRQPARSAAPSSAPSSGPSTMEMT